jgi:hypothetical protein
MWWQSRGLALTYDCPPGPIEQRQKEILFQAMDSALIREYSAVEMFSAILHLAGIDPLTAFVAQEKQLPS